MSEPEAQQTPQTPQTPQSPRRITEISFTSFGSRLEKLEGSPTKEEPEEQARLFWLRVTRDITKLNEMQNVFKYLRGAQLSPTLRKLKMKCYFLNWKRMVTSKRWIDAAVKLRNVSRTNNFKESAERIVYVRSKLTRKSYAKKHDFTPDFNFLSSLVTNVTIAPLHHMKPAEPLPFKEEYEYEEEEEEEEENGEADSVGTPVTIPISSIQNESDKEEEVAYRPVDERAAEIEPEEEVKQIEIPKKEEEPPKKSSKSWILWVVLLAIIGVGVFAFYCVPEFRFKMMTVYDQILGNKVDVAPTTENDVDATAADAQNINVDNANEAAKGEPEVKANEAEAQAPESNANKAEAAAPSAEGAPEAEAAGNNGEPAENSNEK